MKTREQLEKEFDDRFKFLDDKSLQELKEYIFQEILPQVLSEILPKGTIIEENIMNKYKEFLNSKQKAKEMGIKL